MFCNLQIDEVIKDTDKAELMENHIDQYLLMLSLQLRMAYSKYLGDDSVPRSQVIRLYKGLLGSLMAVKDTDLHDSQYYIKI